MKKRIRTTIVVALLSAGLLAVAWTVTQPVFEADLSLKQKPAAETDKLAAALREHVRTLSVEFAPRHHKAPRGLDGAAEYIRSNLERTGAAVEVQSYEVSGIRYQNVLATFGPASNDRTVIGAHYDAFDAHPGADDNASGIAGLLELAKLLSSTPLSHRVELVAYSLEEPPYFRSEFMGSFVHATRLANARVPVRLMISLECIGYFTDAPQTQSFPVPGLNLLYPTTGNFVAVVGRLEDLHQTRLVKSAMQKSSSLPIFSISAPAGLTGIDFSDHMNYWNAGFPAVMITDTAFFRNKAYHTDSDTFERLDYRRMAQVVAGVHAAIVELDRKR